MINIYLDMDGVLCDFDSFYNSPTFCTESFGKLVADEGMFEKLDILPDARELVEFAKSTGANIEILSSLGSPGNTEQAMLAAQQKASWLKTMGFGEFKTNFVEHKGLKKRFATPKSILIDDTPQNIYDWLEHHGVGVLWKTGQGIESLKPFVDAVKSVDNTLVIVDDRIERFKHHMVPG